jgi:hypothetical protein
MTHWDDGWIDGSIDANEKGVRSVGRSIVDGCRCWPNLYTPFRDVCASTVGLAKFYGDSAEETEKKLVRSLTCVVYCSHGEWIGLIASLVIRLEDGHALLQAIIGGKPSCMYLIIVFMCAMKSPYVSILPPDPGPGPRRNKFNVL